MPVYKDKNGTWYYSFKKKNALGQWKTFKKRGFQKKSDASAAEREAIGSATATVSATFNEMAELYDDYNNSSQQTRDKNRQHREQRFADYVNLPVGKLDKQKLMLYRASLAKMDFSTDTKNKTISYLKRVLRFAHQFYGYEDNTYVLSAFKKTDEEVLKEYDVWTPAEFNRFVECVDSELYKIFFTFMFWTGCRRGEAIALQKDCVGDHTVTFKYSQFNQKDGLKPTKGRMKRTIKIDDKLFIQLQPLLETQGNYVFGGDVGLSRDTINDMRIKAIEKSGVKPIRLHDFRHSHATWLINNGVNIIAVSKRLGHRDISTTLKIYTHLLDSTDNEMMEKINSFKNQ